MRANTKAFFIGSLLLTWLILCLLVFVYISRFGFVQLVLIPNWNVMADILAHISPLRYLFELLKAVLGVLPFSLACLSLGLRILRKWSESHASRLALGVTAFLIGEIFLSLIFLTSISLYRLTPVIVTITVVLGFLIGISALKEFLSLFPLHIDRSDLKFGERIILRLSVAALSLGLLLSTTRLGYDATADYFSQAKILALSHLPIVLSPKYPFIVSSFHPEILFTSVIELFGDQSARLLSWVNGLAIVMMGLALGQELGLRLRARLWFLTLMVTTTAFTDLLGDGKIELISTAPILAAIYWMIYGIERPTRSVFALIGLLSGFAIICRPYNIFLVGFFIALFLMTQAIIKYRADRWDFRQFTRCLLWIMPPLFALGNFHLFQNWIWLRNPLAPLAYTNGMSSSDWHWQITPATLTLYRLLYPFTLTFLTSPQTLGNISPLVVGFLPFLFIKRVREGLQFSRKLHWLTLMAALTLLAWITFFFTVLEIRYVLFLWVILFLAMSQVLESATQHLGMFFRPVYEMAVIVFLAFMNIRILMIVVTAAFPSNHTRQTDCYGTNLCDLLNTINQPAALGDRVFALHGYRYYLREDLFACSSRVEEYAMLEPLARANSSEFWAELYRRGFRFIMFETLLSERRYQFGELPETNTAPDWLHIKVLYSSGGATQEVYELEATNPPFSPVISCKQDAAGTWQLRPSAPPSIP